MEFKEFTGKTVDDALTNATVTLGVTSSEIKYEVIEEGSNGFLGIGSKDAVIKVVISGNEDPKDVAKDFLNGVFEAMQLEVNISMELEEADNTLSIDLAGPEMGVLIGKRGQTLDSLQYLTNLAVNRSAENYTRVKIDTEDYRRRRKETLDKFYSNGTQLGTTQEVYVGEKPVAETAVYESCLEGSNIFYGWATEEWIGAIDASTLAGKTVYTGALPDVAADEGDVEYYAVWAKATTTFQKGTSADLKNGQKVVIVHNNSSKALENDGTSWEGADVTINTNQISDPASTIQWTIETTTNGFYLKNGSNQYLKGQNKSGGPYILLTNTTNKWTLTNDGTYVLKDENNRYLEYYSNAFTTFGSYNSNNANCYVMDFYVPVMDDFRTNCCGLKPVTNVHFDN